MQISALASLKRKQADQVLDKTGSKLCVKLIINSSACMKYEYYSNLSCGDLSINYAPGFHYLYWILEQVKYELLDVLVTCHK